MTRSGCFKDKATLAEHAAAAQSDVRREMARRDRLEAKAEAERQRRARIKIDSFSGLSRLHEEPIYTK
jgi:hypothetical protein